MKRINYLLMMLLIASTTIFSSCKKEDKIERNLWSKGGEWDIESLHVTTVSTYAPNNLEETFYYIGTYVFKKDGSGILTLTFDGVVEARPFTYFNSEKKLVLTFGNQSGVYDIVAWEKNTMKISISNIELNSNGTTTTQTLNLKKK